MNTTGPYTPELKYRPMTRHAGTIKQELFEPREPSPPPYLRHRDISPMPPVKTGNESYDISSYRTLQVSNFKPHANNDLKVRKVLFDLIRERPHMWEKEQTKVSIKEWEKIGLEIWKRLDVVVSIEQMRQSWRVAKDGLRRRLRSAIETYSYNPDDTESFLQKWDVYDHFRFFRKRYVVFETELRKLMAGQLADAAAIRAAEEDNDEIIFDGFHMGETSNGMCSSSDGIPDAPYIEYQQQDLPQSRQHLQLDNEPVPQELLMAQPSPAVNVTSTKADIKRKRCESETESSADYLAHEIRRKFRQYPEKETLIRNSVQTLLMAFDDVEANFQSVADVFSDISEQEVAKAAIRARRQNRQ